MHAGMEDGRMEGREKKNRGKGREERREMELQQWKRVPTKTNFVPIGRYLLKTLRKLSQANSLRNKSQKYVCNMYKICFLLFKIL